MLTRLVAIAGIVALAACSSEGPTAVTSTGSGAAITASDNSVSVSKDVNGGPVCSDDTNNTPNCDVD